MARYYKKRRYGGKYGYKKKRYGKMGYRKMKRSKARLYRQGGNYAQQGSKPSPELKSYDLLCYNTGATAGLPNTTFSGCCDQNQSWAGAVTAFASQFPSPAGSWLGPGLGSPPGGGSCLVASNVQYGVPLNSLPIGAALNNRVGRKITMRSIKVDILFQSPGTPASAASTGISMSRGPIFQMTPVRVLLVYDRQTNGAAVQVADVLASAGSSGVGGAAAVSVESSNNLNNRSRFLTLFDKTYTLNSVDTPYRTVRIYKKLNLPVIYNGGAPSTPWDVAFGTNLDTSRWELCYHSCLWIISAILNPVTSSSE